MGPTPGHTRGLGALLLSEVQHVDLGTHGNRTLRARVQRRGARIAIGRGGRLAFEVGHARPVAIEVTDAATGGGRYDLLVPRVRDPRITAVRRILALTLAATLLLRWARRRTTKEAGRE